jgi:hypothetical protein
MIGNIDAYLREYIINGFAAGTSGRCGEVIDEFTDMWCDIDRDGHKYFFKLFGRKKNWRDHVMLESYKNAFKSLCAEDEIVLDTIGSMSLDENMKKFIVKALFDSLISHDLNSKLDEKMNKILKEGKSLEQLNWEYEQEDLWNGHPPSEGMKCVRNSIIERVKDRELLFKGTNEQIHSVVEKCKYILDSSLMNSPCSKEMLQRSHENNKERMANIEKYLDHKKEKGVTTTNDSPQFALTLCNAMPDNIKSTFNPAFIQNVVERRIPYNIMVVTLTDQNTIDGLLKIIKGYDIIGLLKEFKEYRKNKTIYYHVSKISGSRIPVFGDRVYKVVDTYGPRPQNIFWRETMYDECTQFTGRFPSKPDKCFSNLNTQEKDHCVREYFNGSYEFSHKYLSESIIGHVFAEPKQYFTYSSDDDDDEEEARWDAVAEEIEKEDRDFFNSLKQEAKSKMWVKPSGEKVLVGDIQTTEGCVSHNNDLKLAAVILPPKIENKIVIGNSKYILNSDWNELSDEEKDVFRNNSLPFIVSQEYLDGIKKHHEKAPKLERQNTMVGGNGGMQTRSMRKRLQTLGKC